MIKGNSPVQVLPTAVKAVAVDSHHSRVVSFPDLDLELTSLPDREHAHVPDVGVDRVDNQCIFQAGAGQGRVANRAGR